MNFFVEYFKLIDLLALAALAALMSLHLPSGIAVFGDIVDRHRNSRLV